jgi:hypothetical protein
MLFSLIEYRGIDIILNGIDFLPFEVSCKNADFSVISKNPINRLNYFPDKYNTIVLT